MERIFAIEIMRERERERELCVSKEKPKYIHLRWEHDCFILSKTTTSFALVLLKHPHVFARRRKRVVFFSLLLNGVRPFFFLCPQQQHCRDDAFLLLVIILVSLVFLDVPSQSSTPRKTSSSSTSTETNENQETKRVSRAVHWHRPRHRDGDFVHSNPRRIIRPLDAHLPK